MKEEGRGGEGSEKKKEWGFCIKLSHVNACIYDLMNLIQVDI